MKKLTHFWKHIGRIIPFGFVIVALCLPRDLSFYQYFGIFAGCMVSYLTGMAYERRKAPSHLEEYSDWLFMNTNIDIEKIVEFKEIFTKE